MSNVPPFRKTAVAFLAKHEVQLLENWAEEDWSDHFRWLDRSGLALLIAARLGESEMASRIPDYVIRALRERLLNNQERMPAMLNSLDEIQDALTAWHVRFCCLKGFSLIPDCYSSIRERHQVDFDILIGPSNANDATTMLETAGYKLVYAHESGEMRFAKPWTRYLNANSWLYGVSEGPAVELHTRLWEPETNLVDFALPNGWMESICTRTIDGVAIPCLASAWQFLHLFLHVFRHLVSSWVWLLSVYEISVYIDREHQNDELWKQVCLLATTDARLALACALVVRIVSAEFPGKLPELLNNLCRAHLSVESALWVEHFGKQWLYADPPGTKMALLVQRQFCSNPNMWRSYLLRRLLPLRVPYGLSLDAGTRAKRTLQYFIEDLFYRLSRLGYHLVSGCHYLRSAARWRQILHSHSTRPALLF